MNHVRVARCRSYASREAIYSFVVAAIELQERSAGLPQTSGADGLVVVKPNWVQDARQDAADSWEQVISHPEVILAVLEALASRMKSGSTICVCDSPNTCAEFEKIIARGNFRERFGELGVRYPHVGFELLDLRREVWVTREDVVVERRRNREDPRGYVEINLGEESLLHGHAGEGRYYGADYDTTVVNQHHHGAIQEYLIAGTPIACDLFVNVPKMKTHKKTGITCCLKNLVGINGDKNWLPHHAAGPPDSGGDEFPHRSFRNQFESLLKSVGRKGAVSLPGVGPWLYRKARTAGVRVLGDSQTVVRNGNWQGNDTCWRMALDLNRALLYANTDGSLRDAFHPKAYLAIVDGIIGGQGNGPLSPDAVESNVLVAGTNPAEVDATVARLMGYDPREIPIIKHAFDAHRWPICRRQLNDVDILDERVGRAVCLDELTPAVEGGFVPHFGWPGLSANRRT